MREKMKLLFRHLTKLGSAEEPVDVVSDVKFAIAVLLFEVARMDQSVDVEERELIPRLLRTHYGSDEGAVKEYIAEAEKTAETVVSYHPFTSELKSSLGLSQRVVVIEQMWAVALADGVVDMHEEHLIRKVADLLYVPHKEFIAAKLRITEGR